MKDKIYLWIIGLLILFLLLLIFFSGEKKYNFVRGGFENIDYIQLTPIDDSCLLEDRDFTRGFFVNSEFSFNELMQSRLSSCYNVSEWYEENRTILGHRVKISGCSYDMNKSVFRNDITKTVIFDLNFEVEGECDMVLLSYYDVVSIEKVPEDYHIDYDYEVSLF